MASIRAVAAAAGASVARAVARAWRLGIGVDRRGYSRVSSDAAADSDDEAPPSAAAGEAETAGAAAPAATRAVRAVPHWRWHNYARAALCGFALYVAVWSCMRWLVTALEPAPDPDLFPAVAAISAGTIAACRTQVPPSALHPRATAPPITEADRDFDAAVLAAAIPGPAAGSGGSLSKRVMLVESNSGFAAVTENWLAHAATMRPPLPPAAVPPANGSGEMASALGGVLVVALDDGELARLKARGGVSAVAGAGTNHRRLMHIGASTNDSRSTATAAPRRDAEAADATGGGGFAAGAQGFWDPSYKAVVFHKWALVLQALRQGVDVLLSDGDVVLVRNPLAYIDSLPHCDIYASVETDRLFPRAGSLMSTGGAMASPATPAWLLHNGALAGGGPHSPSARAQSSPPWAWSPDAAAAAVTSSEVWFPSATAAAMQPSLANTGILSLIAYKTGLLGASASLVHALAAVLGLPTPHGPWAGASRSYLPAATVSDLASEQPSSPQPSPLVNSLNSGFVYVRSSARTIAVIAEVVKRLSAPGATTRYDGDQPCLNEVLQELFDAGPASSAVPPLWRRGGCAQYGSSAHGGVSVYPLSPFLFQNGKHTRSLRLTELLHELPFTRHYNYVGGSLAGKVAMMKAEGAWLLSPAEEAALLCPALV